MLDTLRAKHPDQRKLIVYIGAGVITLIIASFYFYSVFSSKILASKTAPVAETKSPTKELINSIIFVGKEAGNMVKNGAAEISTQTNVEETATEATTVTPAVESLEQPTITQ